MSSSLARSYVPETRRPEISLNNGGGNFVLVASDRTLPDEALEEASVVHGDNAIVVSGEAGTPTAPLGWRRR